MSKSLLPTTCTSRNSLLLSSPWPTTTAAPFFGPYSSSASRVVSRPSLGMRDLGQILDEALKISQDVNEIILASGHSETGVPTRGSASPEEEDDDDNDNPAG